MIIIFWLIISLLTVFTVAIIAFPLLKYASPWWTKVLILFVIPLISIPLYFHWGASHSLERYWVLKKEARAVKNELAKMNRNPQQLINQLRAHLRVEPRSAKGWYLLGQLYFGSSQYDKAAHSLYKAFQIQPTNNQYAVAYVQAAFFYQHRSLTAQNEVILKTVVKRSPDYAPALNLLAINAYLQKKYQLAVNYWQKLLPLFSPSTKDGQTLLRMIAMAQKHIAAQNAAKVE